MLEERSAGDTVKIVPAFDHPEDVRELFTEYTQMLVEGDPAS